MKSKSMKKDGAYGKGSISGYNETDASGKLKFAKDGLALLHDVGRILADDYGVSSSWVKFNPGGPAVSGETYGYFWRSEDPIHGAMLEVGTSLVSRERQDGLCIIMRTRERSDPQDFYFHGAIGSNHWLNPELDSAQLAEKVARLLDGRK